MFLTQKGGFIMKPISKLLGAILNLIYEGLSSLGVINIGFAIILVTVLIRLCMVPNMYKQKRTSTIINYIQPELNKIAKKYRNKKDQQSMLAQQQETRELQEKYGASMTGGCISSLIQLPIFMAMFNVIQNIPAYVHQVKNLYNPIAQAIANDPVALEKFKTLHDNEKVLKSISFSKENTDTIIDVLSKFSQNTWDKFVDMFNGKGAVVDAINQNLSDIQDRYNFFGIDLTTAPGFALTIALIIPILSFIFQYLSMHATPQQTPSDPVQEQTMKTMKTMLNVMPFMSLFISITAPAGLGLYWAMGSLLSFLTSISLNAYFKRTDVEKIVEKSKQKAAKKIAKRKAKGKKTFMERMQESANAGQNRNSAHVNSNLASTSLKNYTSNTMNNSSGTTKYKAGSLASKANVMQRYNNDKK